MIHQEIYALFCRYQAIRVLISRAVGTVGLYSGASPSPVPATGSGTGSATPGPFPDGLDDLAFEITCKRNLVPERPRPATTAAGRFYPFL